MDQFGRKDINDALPEERAQTPSVRSVGVGRVRSGEMGLEPMYSNKRSPEDGNDGYWLGFDPIDHVLKFVLGGKLSRLLYKLGGFRFDLWDDSQAGNAIYINDERPGNLPSLDVRRSVGSGGAAYMESSAGSALQMRQTSDAPTEKVVGTAVKAGSGGVSEAVGESGTTAPVRLNRAQGTGAASHDMLENAASQSPVRTAQSGAQVSSHFWRMDRKVGGIATVSAQLQEWISDGTSPNGILTGNIGDTCVSASGKSYQCRGGTVWDETATVEHGPTRYAVYTVLGYATDAAVADGLMYLPIPPAMDGWRLTYCHAYVVTPGTTDVLEIGVYNLTDAAEMLLVGLTVDSGENGSETADVPYQIDPDHDTVAENDVVRVDIEAIHATPSKGLVVTLGFDPA